MIDFLVTLNKYVIAAIVFAVIGLMLYAAWCDVVRAWDDFKRRHFVGGRTPFDKE